MFATSLEDAIATRRCSDLAFSVSALCVTDVVIDSRSVRFSVPSDIASNYHQSHRQPGRRINSALQLNRS